MGSSVGASAAPEAGEGGRRDATDHVGFERRVAADFELEERRLTEDVNARCWQRRALQRRQRGPIAGRIAGYLARKSCLRKAFWMELIVD